VYVKDTKPDWHILLIFKKGGLSEKLGWFDCGLLMYTRVRERVTKWCQSSLCLRVVGFADQSKFDWRIFWKTFPFFVKTEIMGQNLKCELLKWQCDHFILKGEYRKFTSNFFFLPLGLLLAYFVSICKLEIFRWMTFGLNIST